MKWMIASDIHGSAHFCRLLLSAMEREGAERLVLLGDVLYHGPRNDLPEGYAPKEVIALLNGVADRILCVRGNCDTEVDQMVLHFPLLSEYAWIMEEGRTYYFAHGHKAGPDDPPPMPKGSLLFSGHTHVAGVFRKEGFVNLNPGSVSIPKENTPQGYILAEGGSFSFRTLEGNEYLNYSL